MNTNNPHSRHCPWHGVNLNDDLALDQMDDTPCQCSETIDTLELMLEAERRESTDYIGGLGENDEYIYIRCATVVESITTGINFDEKVMGEIDPVNQSHYLVGPNTF